MTLLALAAAVAVAAAVQTIGGFGFALVAAPALVALTDPVAAVGALAVLGVLVSAVTLGLQRGRPDVLRADAAVLVAWAIPGLPLGAWLLTRVPGDAVRVAVGLIVLAALAQRRLGAGAPARPRPGRLTRPLAGLASGALTTTTGLNGPPLVLALTGRDVPPRTVRDTLAAAFVALGLGGAAALALAGGFELPEGFAALLPAAVVGGLAGHRLHDRMDDAARARATTVVLLAAALVALGSVLR